MSFLHTVPRSFGYAWSGLRTAFKNEPNFRVHTLATIMVITLGLVFRLNSIEWSILTLTIGLVISLELINTCLESLVNMVSPQISEGAKIAKDTVAAAVMVAAIVSVIVGLLVFLPKII